LPAFRGIDNRAALHGRIHIGPSVDYLERAFDASKYGRISAEPYLDMSLPTLNDPSLAPPGKHVLSIHVQFAPFKLADSTWDAARDILVTSVMRTLDRYAPGIEGLVEHRQVITPLDLERTYGLTGGHIYHGEPSLDQLFTMRPVLGWSQYRTPIGGLYLCGAGTHPGGGVTAGPGQNAAREILRDLK
jgi:phytoene dehydrogenase-like protein